MATPVKLPALGESVTEGTVTRWLKQPGDSVEVDEPLLEVSTDKVDTEIPSPVAGTLLEIKVDEDETVEVGAELALVGDASESDGGGGADGDGGGSERGVRGAGVGRGGVVGRSSEPESQDGSRAGAEPRARRRGARRADDDSRRRADVGRCADQRRPGPRTTGG